MKKKSIAALVLAVSMVLSSSVSAFAAEDVNGVGWWDATNTKSTPVALADGGTVAFDIDVEDAASADDTYAAFCVEVSDGTSYFTTTSAGDCWGFPEGTGTVIKDTGKADAVKGNSYHVEVTRDGNNFTATYTDKATGEPMFGTLMITGAVDFADTTVYVMGQVGKLSVDGAAVEAAADTTDTADTTDATDAATTSDAPKTGVESFALFFALGAAAFGTGAVVLKKKAN